MDYSNLSKTLMWPTRAMCTALLATFLTSCGGGGGGGGGESAVPESDRTSGGSGQPVISTPMPDPIVSIDPQLLPELPSSSQPAPNETNPNEVPPNEPPPAEPDVFTPPSNLLTNVDSDGGMAFVSALGSSRAYTQIAPESTADITLETTLTGQGQQTYRINFAGGAVSPAMYSAIQLPPVSKVATIFDHKFRDYSVRQFNAFIPTNQPSKQGYAVTVQSLGASGFQHVGMGHWKYVGQYNSGYFSGHDIAHGSFLIGTPAQPQVTRNIPSAGYSGYAQAGIEGVSSYIDDFNELRANVGIQYDEASRTLSLRLDYEQIWFAYYMRIEESPTFYRQSQSYTLPFTQTCTTTVPQEGNVFSCDLRNFEGNLIGTFKGKFFGPEATEIGGTFALRGYFQYGWGEVMAGAFVAKRN